MTDTARAELRTMPEAIVPVRLQRSRRKGTRLVSPNGLPVVCVSRPSIFGNPFTVKGARDVDYLGTDDELHAWCCRLFREWVTDNWRHGHGQQGRLDRLLERLPELRGKNLACFCPLDKPCHADVLLELANTNHA